MMNTLPWKKLLFTAGLVLAAPASAADLLINVVPVRHSTGGRGA